MKPASGARSSSTRRTKSPIRTGRTEKTEFRQRHGGKHNRNNASVFGSRRELGNPGLASRFMPLFSPLSPVQPNCYFEGSAGHLTPRATAQDNRNEGAV